ncbi:MAG: DUF4304 domain-containing protein [Pseudomonadota bacterium]
MADELAKAITKLANPVLKQDGFQRLQRRKFIRSNGRIVQRLDFQVTSWGGRDFCVNVSANLIASNEFVTLQPGFRLSDYDGRDAWLPSKTMDDAEASVKFVTGLIQEQAFPFLARTNSVEGFSDVLGQEDWASSHHLKFQQGVAAALLGDANGAKIKLRDAIRLYEADGRDWFFAKIDKATKLCEALDAGCHAQLLNEWEQENSESHGVV